MINLKTIGEYVGMDPIVVNPGYEDFFTKVMSLVNSAANIDNVLGEKIRELALGFPKLYALDKFNIPSNQSYKRTYLGKDTTTGWEMLLMTWYQGRQSTVHGHPQFASYNILQGVVRLEVFEDIGEGKAKLVDTLEVKAGKGFFAVGVAGTMTNHIHRISCISDMAYSLHIYSDDSRKGVLYDVV